MPKSRFPLLVALSAILLWETPEVAAAGNGDQAGKAPAAAVATEQKPATVQVRDAAQGGVALEVTARPVRGAAASPPYLVGVYDQGQPGGAPKLLGSFSFYPPRAGEAQTFVIPGPQLEGSMTKGKDMTLSIKLIPANPAADIKGAAVEILGARAIR
jgi:hypothetical protein